MEKLCRWDPLLSQPRPPCCLFYREKRQALAVCFVNKLKSSKRIEALVKSPEAMSWGGTFGKRPLK
jgi:hypothetical protein